MPQCRVPLPHVPGSGPRLPQTEVQKQRPRRGAMTEAAAAAPPGSPRGRRGGRPLAARRGGAARRSRSRRRRCCPSSPCPRHSPARLLAPFSLRFRLKGGREKELGRHFPSAAAATATARRAGGRTKRLSEADSSCRGGLGGGRSALPGREEAPGVAVGVRARAADGGACLCGAGGAALPSAPARPPGLRFPTVPRPAGTEEGRRKGSKEKKKRPLPAAAFPSPFASPPRPESQGGSGRRGGGERRAGSEPPPRASARWSSAPRPGGCLQTAPILWGRIRPGYAPPSRGRCCCCSSPPPPAALSPSPRSLCGSHFSLSLLVVTRKAGQGTKNPRNFKWPLRASPLRVRAGSRPKGGGVRGPFPTSCRLVRRAFLWRSI